MIAMSLKDLLDALGVPPITDEEMGPLAKAYEHIMDKDKRPLDTLTRFGLTEDDIKECKPIMDHIAIVGLVSLREQPLSLFLGGLFVGLEVERNKNEVR